MDAIPLSGMYGAMALAAKIVATHNQDMTPEKAESLGLVNGLREALQTLTLTSALITYIQDEDNPVMRMGPEDEVNEAVELTPADILRRLADAWEEGPGAFWEEDVEQFKSTFNSTMAEVAADKFNKEFPDDLNVSDILGENKED